MGFYMNRPDPAYPVDKAVRLSAGEYSGERERRV